jgi:D-alanyl-D-alanine carboxypeptidase
MKYLLFAIAFVLAAPAVAEPATSTASMDAALADVRTMVETAPGELGLVVAVTDRDQLRMVATHGYADIERRMPVTPETRFAIGSISKSFTAITLMQLADEGRFDPDAPISRYLPDFHPRTTFPAITGHALLTHTAGLPNYMTDVASMRYLIAALNEFEPRYAPGANFWYSNSGYQLLGYAVERIEHRPFPLVLQQRMLDRLGMTATAPQLDDRLRGTMAESYTRTPDGAYVRAPWFDYLAADGAIVSTAADMSAYGRMLLARGDTPKGRLISARAFDRFAKPALDDYGYGIDVKEGGRMLAHSGGIAGFQAYLAAYPADGYAVVFLGNGPMDNALRDRILTRLSQAAGGAAKPPADVAAKPSADVAGFAGRFIDSKGGALVFAANASGGLSLEEEGKALPLTRLGENSWGLYLTPKGPRAFTFFRDAAQAVTDVVEGASDYAKPAAAKLAATPAAYLPLVGRYRMHGEEGPDMRILARDGRLLLAYIGYGGDPMILEEAGPGRFRPTMPAHSPEWISFDTIIDGQAQRMKLTGVSLYRIDLP